MYYLLLHITYVENLIKIFFMWVYLFQNFSLILNITVNIIHNWNVGSSFQFILKVGVEESIVNAPRITDRGSAV
jgi:hypothetical protein